MYNVNNKSNDVVQFIIMVKEISQNHRRKINVRDYYPK